MPRSGLRSDRDRNEATGWDHRQGDRLNCSRKIRMRSNASAAGARRASGARPCQPDVDREFRGPAHICQTVRIVDAAPQYRVSVRTRMRLIGGAVTGLSKRLRKGTDIVVCCKPKPAQRWRWNGLAIFLDAPEAVACLAFTDVPGYARQSREVRGWLLAMEGSSRLSEV